MYDPLRAKMKVALYTAAAAVMGLGIASALGWSAGSYTMPVIGSEPQIPIQAVPESRTTTQAATIRRVVMDVSFSSVDGWLDSTNIG